METKTSMPDQSIGGTYSSMKKLVLHLTLASFVGGICLIGTAAASPVGTLNIANCPGGGVTVTATSITWSPAGTTTGTGCVATGLGTNVAFSGGTLVAGTIGNIKDLVAGPPMSVDQFMVFPAMGPIDLDFVLNGFGAGSSNTNCAGATSVGSSCSVVAGSPFVLTYLGLIAGKPTTTISLSAFGDVIDTSGSSGWSGGFSTQINLTPGAIQSAFATAGSIQSTQSAQFILTAVPEPITVLLIGAGLVLLALVRRPRHLRQ